MQNEKDKLNRLFWLFLVMGVLGLVDIASQTIFHQDFGIVSMSIAYVFGLLFGIKVASLVGVILGLVVGFSLIWIILAVYIKIKIKKISESR